MLKHFLWDFDGTLFNSYPALVEAFRRALEEHGVKATKEEIFGHMIVSIAVAWDHYSEVYNLPEDCYKRFRQLQKELEPELLEPMPYAMEICAEIVRRGGKNYVYTHRDEKTKFFMERCGMDQYFTDYMTSDVAIAMGFPMKPAPDAVRYLVAKHGMDPDEAVMIGDRPIDVQAGKNAGIHGCFYDSGRTGRDGGADWIIYSLEEMEKLM